MEILPSAYVRSSLNRAPDEMHPYRLPDECALTHVCGCIHTLYVIAEAFNSGAHKGEVYRWKGLSIRIRYNPISSGWWYVVRKEGLLVCAMSSEFKWKQDKRLLAYMGRLFSVEANHV